jgi:hypothetical protein
VSFSLQEEVDFRAIIGLPVVQRMARCGQSRGAPAFKKNTIFMIFPYLNAIFIPRQQFSDWNTVNRKKFVVFAG